MAGGGRAVAAATALCVFGLRDSPWVNIVFTLIEAGGLVLFVAVGAGAPGFGAALATPPHFGVMSGAALVFFAYLGFEEIANLAEETRSSSLSHGTVECPDCRADEARMSWSNADPRFVAGGDGHGMGTWLPSVVVTGQDRGRRVIMLSQEYQSGQHGDRYG